MDNLSASEWDFLCREYSFSGRKNLIRLIEKAMHTNARYDEAGYPL